MKKTVKLLIIVFMTFLFIKPTNVYAASAGFSTANRTVTVGDSFTVTLSINPDQRSAYQVGINISGSAISQTGGTNGLSEDTDSKKSETYNFKADSVGTATISLNSDSMISELVGDFKSSSLSASITITVVAKTVTPPTNPTNPTNPSTPTTPEEPEEVETALISAVEITSNSTKQKGEKLTSLEVSLDKKEAAYTLPERIDSFTVNAVKASEGATLTYDTEYTFAANESTKTVTIVATEGDYNQTYTITITKTASTQINVSVDSSDMNVYSDSRLDSFAESLGLTKTDVTINGVATSMFVISDIKLLLVVDADNNAYWVMLNDDNTVFTKVDLIYFEGYVTPFISKAVAEENQSKTLHQESLSSYEFTVSDLVKNIDTDLNFTSVIQGWRYNNGYVVYGEYNGHTDYYFYNSETNAIQLAVVAFDQQSSGGIIPWVVAGVSSTLMLITTVSFILYTMNEKKKNTNKNAI